VIAGLAGIGKSTLSQIERGERALDSRSEIVALATALQISPSELIGEPVTAPGDEHPSVQAMRDALLAATHHHPGGQVTGGWCVLALCRSLVAATVKRSSDADAALEHAAELAMRTGEGNAYWMSFGPTNVGCWRMHAALEFGDHEGAVAVAEGMYPGALHVPKYQAYYWANYGRALARARDRRNDAALALRRAELISPRHLQRDPLAREALSALVARAKQGAVSRELRGMAYRAGLPA